MPAFPRMVEDKAPKAGFSLLLFFPLVRDRDWQGADPECRRMDMKCPTFPRMVEDKAPKAGFSLLELSASEFIPRRTGQNRYLCLHDRPPEGGTTNFFGPTLFRRQSAMPEWLRPIRFCNPRLCPTHHTHRPDQRRISPVRNSAKA